MKNLLVGIVFLFGTVLGMLAATQVGEELLYKVPAKYLTFGRPSETQGAAKVYYGKRPENGKILYITGGSLGRSSGNEHSLAEKLTEKLGVPVEVYNISSNGQRLPESFSMIEKMPDSTGKGQVYVAMTYGGHRTSTASRAAIKSAFTRDRMLMRHDAVRDLIENENLLEKPFVTPGKSADMIPEEYLAALDKEYTASIGSHWLNYFLYDKLKKLTRKVPPKNIFVDKDVFAKNEYSPVRLKGVAKSFEKNRARYELSHKKYYDILVRTVKGFTPEQAQKRRDFALYFMEKSSELAAQKGYGFAALELPTHSSLHHQPIVSDYRVTFNTQLQALSTKKGFPIFYLDDDIKELDVFHNWTDTGHISPIGRYVYEKYYVDALAKFMSGDQGGVYGDVAIPSPPSETKSQDE